MPKPNLDDFTAEQIVQMKKATNGFCDVANAAMESFGMGAEHVGGLMMGIAITYLKAGGVQPEAIIKQVQEMTKGRQN